MRYSATGIVIIASTASYFIGLWLLGKKRRWTALAVALVLVLGYPALAIQAFAIADKNLRMWVGILLAMVFPIWLLSGFMVRAAALDEQQPAVDPGNGWVRAKGGLAIALAALAWSVGATTPYLPNALQALLVGMTGYGLLFGTIWLSTGRPYSQF